MKPRCTKRFAASLTATLCLLTARLLTAPLVSVAQVPLSFEQTVGEAQSIFIGTLEGVTTRWGDPSRTWMETDYDFTIEEAVLEDARIQRGRTVTLTYWGGQIGPRHHFIAGQPLFVKGNRYLLMLNENYALPAARNPLVRGSQGWFTVRRHEDGRELVFDHRGEPVVAVGSQLFRQQDIVSQKAIADPVPPDQLLRVLKSDLKRIKSLPGRPVRRANERDGRQYKFRKMAASRRPIDTTDIRIQRPQKVVAARAFPPIAPRNRHLVRGGGESERTPKLEPSKSSKYATETAAILPIVFNQLPENEDFAPWAPVDQACMSVWNEYFPEMFRVLAEPLDEVGWLNGVNDVLGFYTPEELRDWGHVDATEDIGSIVFVSVENGVNVEMDIAFIGGQDWTLDDEAVYSGELTGVKCFRREMMAALATAIGLGPSNGVSLTSYAQEHWNALSLPFCDDVTGLRQLYTSSLERANLLVNLLSSPGTGDWQPSTFPEAVVPGGDFTVGKYLLENAGAATAPEPKLEWYLCEERDWRSRYVYLGTSTYPELPAGSYFVTNESIERTFTVPADTRPGEYYLGVYIPDDPIFSQGGFPGDSNSAFSRTKVTVTAN